MKVSVSILRNSKNYKDEVKKINKTSCDYLHLDILDNTFAPNFSFNLIDFASLKIDKPLDIHIMSTNLDYQVKEAIKLKPKFITIQYESTKDISKYIKMIKDNNIKVGLAINPNTWLFRIKKYLNQVDMIIVMGVYAGFGGQKFIPKTIKRLKKLNTFGRKYILSLDGGVNKEVIDQVKDYIDIAVVGSYVTASDDYEKQIKNITEM